VHEAGGQSSVSGKKSSELRVKCRVQIPTVFLPSTWPGMRNASSPCFPSCKLVLSASQGWCETQNRIVDGKGLWLYTFALTWKELIDSDGAEFKFKFRFYYCTGH